MRKLLRSMRREVIESTYDPNRPGTSVLVDAVAVKLAAADISSPLFKELYWAYGVSPSVVILFNPKLKEKCDTYDKIIKSKRAEKAKIAAESNKARQVTWHQACESDEVGLQFNNKTVTLSNTEQQSLKRVAKDLIKRSAEWHAAQKEAANQELAVNAISELLGVEAYA
jgi:hypothetical protein